MKICYSSIGQLLESVPEIQQVHCILINNKNSKQFGRLMMSLLCTGGVLISL